MWEIYAYHNTDALFGIFNAVAAIMGSGTYLSAIAAVGFCGFVAAMVAYMFAPEKLQGWKWLGTVVLVYGVLFVPRVTVGIVDKTGGTPVKVVANVPFGMAALGGLSSTIGNSITELFETAFQTIPGPASLPSELSYQQNGLMFGSRLIQETRKLSLPDPAVRTDMLNFVNNCTAYDLADGTLSPTAFSKADDLNLWTLMGNTNPARFSILTTSSGVTTATCDQVYASLDSRLPAQDDDLLSRVGLRLNPSLSAAAAKAAVLNQVPQAYIRSQIATASSTAAGLIRQNALMNAINDAGEMGCQRVNDPSCMMLATGRASAVASQNAAWINGAKIAEQALPVVRNVAEALCYAVFPLIVLLLFLSSGKTTLLMLTGYVTALVSIQLWPPLFAILNYMATIYSQLDQAAAAELGGGVKGLALQTGSPIYSNAISAQAVVSYLVIGIPMLAYALANRMVNFGSTLVGGLAGLQSTVGNASAAAALGNSSIGNVTMDQRTVSPMTSNAEVSRTQDERGNWWTKDGAGRTAVSLLRNEGLTSHQVTAKVSQSDVEAANKTASAAAADVVSSSSAKAATLNEALTRVRQKSSSSRSNAGQGLSGFEEISTAAERLSTEARRISKETGYDESQVAGTLLRFSATPSAYGIGGGATVEKRYGASLSDSEKKILDHSNAESYRAAKSFGDRATQDRAFLNSLASEGQSGASLASTLSQTSTRAETAERRFSEAVSHSEETRRAFERGETITRDLSQDPAFVDAVMEYERVAAQYGNNTQSLAAYFSSRLGNYSLTPSKLSDGSALPAGFEGVRQVAAQQAGAPVVNPSIRGVKAANDQVVRNRPIENPSAPPAEGQPGDAPMPSAPEPLPGTPALLRDRDAFRTDTEAQRSAQDQANGSEHGTFDARHEIERKSDGGLVTHQSLVGTSAKNLKRDAAVVLDDATAKANANMAKAKEEAANSPRQKAIDSTPEIPPMTPNAGRRRPRQP